jgi:hypothetical protein
LSEQNGRQMQCRESHTSVVLPSLLNDGQRLHGADKRRLKKTKKERKKENLRMHEKSTVTKEERT